MTIEQLTCSPQNEKKAKEKEEKRNEAKGKNKGDYKKKNKVNLYCFPWVYY